jgi:flagellar protein FliS
MLSSRLSEYNRTAVMSATPGQLLTMLYDRLLLDLSRAQLAQEKENWPAASVQLLHAQQIISELQSTLDVEGWTGGPGLFALYTYIGTGLMKANINRDAFLTAECTALLEPLRLAWIEATLSSTRTEMAGGWAVA